MGKDLNVAVYVGPFIGNEIRELGENAPNFFFFIQLQFTDSVVLLDHRQRLDEKGGATCRLVVNDALHLRLVFGAHGYDVAALALRYD